MDITIREEVCKKYNLTLGEVLAILLIKSGSVSEIIKSLENREAVVKSLYDEFLVTQRWDDIVSNILLDSDKLSQPSNRIGDLASKLMEVFPKEKKVGTCHYFRGNLKDNTLRLKKFFKLYGNKYSNEQIIEAANKYVQSFNGDYTYMRILKYFIWKDEKKYNEEGKMYIEETSDLATWIENIGQEDVLNDNWMNTLR